MGSWGHFVRDFSVGGLVEILAGNRQNQGVASFDKVSNTVGWSIFLGFIGGTEITHRVSLLGR